MTRSTSYLKMNSDCLAVVIFLLLCHLSSFINAQACVPEHPQRNFCEAAWAIKGKVIEFMDTPSNIRGDAPIERQYHIRVDRVYKKPISWNGSWKKGKKTWITTDGDMANQGVQLKEGKSYMLTGMDREGRAFMTRCNWHQRWTGVKKCHRAALQSGVFTRNCFCQISTCHGANCYQPVQRSGCVNNNNERSLDVCVFNNNLGTCDWNACGLLENKRRKAFIERRKNLALGPAYQQQKQQQQAQIQQQLALQQQQQRQQQQYLQQQQEQYQQQQLLQTIQQHLQQQQAPPTTAAPSLFDMGMGGMSMGMGMGEGMGMGMGMGMDIL